MATVENKKRDRSADFMDKPAVDYGGVLLYNKDENKIRRLWNDACFQCKKRIR